MSKTIKAVIIFVGFVASLVTLYVFFDLGELLKRSHWKIDEAEGIDFVASLDASETTEDEATLMVTCNAPTPFQLNVLLDWHYALRSIDGMGFGVQYRFNAGRFVSDEWSRTTLTAIMISSRDKTLRFLNKAQNSDILEVQVLLDPTRTMSATFELHGSDDVINGAIEACDLSA